MKKYTLFLVVALALATIVTPAEAQLRMDTRKGSQREMTKKEQSDAAFWEFWRCYVINWTFGGL